MKTKTTMQILSALGLAAAIVAAAAAEDQADAAPVWHLATEARVDSAGIFLNQIVSATPPVALPQIRLAPAPTPGQTTFFSRSQIIALAQSNAPALNTTNWNGPARVRVVRRMRPLDETEMTALLQAAFQSNYVKDLGELELRFSQPWTTASVPDEALTVTITEAPGSGLNSIFQAAFDLHTATERVGHWQSVLQAKIWRPIPLARSLLSRGELLRDADVTMERRDILTVRDAVLNPPAGETLELTQSVAVGMPVLNRTLRQRPLIKRGQMVEAVFEDGSLKISLKVEALEDGVLGQSVRLRNPKTRHELYGKVQNEESVSITL
jgi:flagella basal body P-ring formation protein FlgA